MQKLIPGLLDNTIEFFNFEDDVKFISDGKLKSFTEAPASVIIMLKEAIDKKPEAKAILMDWHPESEFNQLKQFASCKFGGIDYSADIKNGELQEGEYFGFSIESGLATIVDAEAKESFVKFIDEFESKGNDVNLYDDYFNALFVENAKNNPKYQSEEGDWTNWTVPVTEFKAPIFQAGFGEGIYPAYFGYNAKGEIVAFYIQFIDAELEDSEEDEDWL